LTVQQLAHDFEHGRRGTVRLKLHGYCG